MRDSTVTDQPGDFRQGDDLHFDIFGRILLGRIAEGHIPDQVGITAVGMDGGVRVDHPQKYRFIAGIAGLFEQLTPGGLGWGFSIIEHTAGNLQGEIFSSEAELFNQNNFLIGSEGDYIHPIDGIDEVKVMLFPGTGRAVTLTLYTEYTAGLDYLGMK